MIVIINENPLVHRRRKGIYFVFYNGAAESGSSDFYFCEPIGNSPCTPANFITRSSENNLLTFVLL